MELEIKEQETEKQMKVIGTYVSQDIYNQLQKESKENFITISSLLKKIIYNYIESK